jgi:hypothetical protein
MGKQEAVGGTTDGRLPNSDNLGTIEREWPGIHTAHRAAGNESQRWLSPIEGRR